MFNTVIRGSTSNIIRVKIRSATSPFNGQTGILFNTTGLVINVIRNNEATSTQYKSAATATIQDVTTLGTYAAPSAGNCRFKQVDATNHPGLYEIQFLDDRFSLANSRSLFITIKGVAGMAESDTVVTLVDVNPHDAVRFGMTSLLNVASTAAGGMDGIIPDSVPGDGTRPTPFQALYMIQQFLFERSVSGTTLTIKKPDGTTAMLAFTLSDASAPVSITRIDNP